MDFEISIGGTQLTSGKDNFIRKVVVMSDSIDTNLRERSAGVLCRVEIAFTIRNETKEWVKELLGWSFKTRDSLYRDVSIKVSSSDGDAGNVEQIRTITIPKMFCEDCYESYDLGSQANDDSKAEDLFIIKMIQRGGNFENIENGN